MTQETQAQEIRKALKNKTSETNTVFTNEELDKNLFKPPSYKGPDSFAEAIEIVKKHEGIPLKEIPFNERIGYAEIELILPRENTPLGVQEQQRLIAKAVDWGGMHIQYPNKNGSVECVRLDDSNPTIVQVVFNMGNIPQLEMYLRKMGGQVFRMGLIFQAVVSFVELDQINKQANYLAMQVSGNLEEDEEDDEAFKWKGLNLAGVYLDPKTISVTAGMSNINPEDTNKLNLILYENQIRNTEMYRKQRISELREMQAPVSSINQAGGVPDIDV